MVVLCWHRRREVSDWGVWPLHFFDRPVLKLKKKRPNRHAVKCLTWWKIVHQIASFKTTFSKKLQLLRGAHPPQTPPPASHKRDRFFYFQKFGPPPHFENHSAAYGRDYCIMCWQNFGVGFPKCNTFGVGGTWGSGLWSVLIKIQQFQLW